MSGPSTQPQFMLFTDGACLGNPGPGGWAYILRDVAGGCETDDAGGEDRTTNNRMELTAVIEGLKALDGPCRLTLVGDSQYVLKGLTEWMAGWKRRGWRKSDKKPVLNADLWRELDELVAPHTLSVEWVRGHIGHPENERCDQLATTQAELIREGKQ